MALYVLYWHNFVSGTVKLHKKSEAAVSANHVLSFYYDADQEYVQGAVQASMRDRSYKVSVGVTTINQCLIIYSHSPGMVRGGGIPLKVASMGISAPNPPPFDYGYERP